jgi:hypothetical protein
MGETSSLTLDKKGIAFGVDFTGASGADVLLVTTGKAKGQRVKLGKHSLTLFSPTAEKTPEVNVTDGKAVIGKQTVSLDKDGNIVFGHTGK